LLLDGSGKLIIRHGGALEATTGFPGDPSILENVTVLGGLTLDSGFLRLSGTTRIENANGTGPGTITLNSSSTSSGFPTALSLSDTGVTITDASLTTTIHLLNANHLR
jgi:hypothetical protein